MRIGVLFEEHLDLGKAAGRANVGDKALTLVMSALAGGDCIDDAAARRASAAGTGPSAALSTIDVDSTICEAYSLAKEVTCTTRTPGCAAITPCSR